MTSEPRLNSPKNDINLLDTSHRIEQIALITYGLLAIWLFIVHEPWADEAQAWLIAASYDNPLSMLTQAGYEGSPMIWHLILWVLSHLGFDIWSMRLIHSIFSIITAYHILLYAPFHRYQRVLAIFGYYFIFEYSAIARSYGLTIMFLAILGKIYEDRKEKNLFFGILLALIAQTNIHGLIFSLVIFGSFILEELVEDFQPVEIIRQNHKLIIPYVTSIILTILVLLPPEDLPEALANWSSIRSSDPIGYAQFFTMRGFFPIHTLEPHFWTYDLRLSIFTFLQSKVIASVILVLMFLQLVRKGYPLLQVFPTIIGYNILFVYKRGICPRHCGLIYIAYFFVLWFSYYYPDIKYSEARITQKFKELFSKDNNESGYKDKEQNRERESSTSQLYRVYKTITSNQSKSKILTLFLVIQLLSAPIPIYYDTTMSFSHARDVGEFLNENDLARDDILLAAHAWFPTMGIIPHLPEEHQELYFIEQERYGTYITWNIEFFTSQALEPEEVINRTLSEFQNGTFSELVLILDYEMFDENFYDIFEQLKYFENAIIGDENFYLYTLR